MKLSLSFFKSCFFPTIKSIDKFTNILLYPAELSKYGSLQLQDMEKFQQLFKLKKESLVVVWDLLPNDNELEAQAKTLDKWLQFCSAVSFQDPGIGLFLQTKYPDLKLHLNLERFSHNLHSSLNWEKIFTPQLEKITLANLIPLATIKKWQTKLKTPLELLALGRQEIFYSPRKLLNPNSTSVNNQEELSFIESTDRLGVLNPLIQTAKGSILFNAKDVCILQYLPELEQAGIKYLRLDPYDVKHFEQIEEVLKSNKTLASLAELWENKHLAGFLKANKTEAQFKMLKNKYLYPAEKTAKKLGYIIENNKHNYSTLCLEKEITLPCSIIIYTPEAKKIEVNLKELQSLNSVRKQKKQAKAGYYKAAYIPNAVHSSLIYQN